MAQPLLIYGIFLACVFISVEAAETTNSTANATGSHLLECRVCRSAIYLDDCIETQICASNEECYIEEIITPQLQVVFNAGCRSKEICKTTESERRKRAEGSGLIACSHCCDVHKTNISLLECNVKLCGIETNSDHTNQCYYCGEDDDAKQTQVKDPTSCRKIKFCADNEVCRVTTKGLVGGRVHEFGCHSRLACQLLTIVSLREIHVQANVSVTHLQQTGEIQFTTGRRQTSVCDVCCGDGLCNNDSCFTVRRRIVPFVQAHKFNFTTLTIIP